MLNLSKIHKPTNVADALEMLAQPNTVVIGGGTGLIADKRRDVTAVVDLFNLGLAYIREANGMIAIGATTTLSGLDDSPILRALANGVIALAAHRSVASILRNQATIAGTLICEPDGILAVALLALDARVTIAGKVNRIIALAEFLEALGQSKHPLVLEISVPMANLRAALQTVERTPSDKPIVAVCVAAGIENNIARNTRIALGGVSEIALRASAAEKELEGQALAAALIDKSANLAAQGLAPHNDYRGSAEYRRDMARVLTRRALMEINS
jgi:aerobic carbon-monoxide dehydrogenase medium subunit